VSRREAVSRIAVAIALACAGIPLVGPALSRWATAQERKRLILAQLQHQAQREMEHYARNLAEQHGYGERLSFIRSRKVPPSMRIYGDPALLRRPFLRPSTGFAAWERRVFG
jgi:hypothetical protein